MFAYCENNPVNNSDQFGTSRNGFGTWFRNTIKRIQNVVSNTFGAGAKTVHQTKQETEKVPIGPNLLLSFKIGTRESNTVSSKGDFSKPVTAYAIGRSDNPLLSSAGCNINISNFTLNLSLGLDNIGVSGAITKGNTTKSYGVTADVTQFKVGFEKAVTQSWGNLETTEYVNASVTGLGLAAIKSVSAVNRLVLLLN